MANSICISSGHALKVRGAGKYLDEVNEARRVVNRVGEYLRQLGCTVYTYHDDTSTTVNQNLGAIVNFHNSKVRDMDISIHFNAGGGTGTEVCYYDAQGFASTMSRAVANAQGLKDRGAKQRTDLYFLRKTAKPAILIEVCFVDSQADANAYNAHFDNVCRAIAETLSGKSISQPVPQPTPQPVSSNSITVGSIVTVKQTATNYADGKTIASFVRGNKYKVIQVKNVSISFSKKAYLLDQIMGWVLEQDIIESGIDNHIG